MVGEGKTHNKGQGVGGRPVCPAVSSVGMLALVSAFLTRARGAGEEQDMKDKKDGMAR
ncbi:Hypothetical protein DEACI_1143 [Acididesulfobacillus acetoxydans]|uniref:Uncharacterized protein n=1 Tax=Acididesulfobacillus acetoxydans TaxID=1561005 RepID=A0A8S0X412_9FIRM|nr:Hypothetical protein DEACI_1143 [Acididesulfobacillus acetoxydans]CEJ06624.1 Hypothetical protein DEACI_1073 [Acididesulfobacillus acetoxydans]